MEADKFSVHISGQLRLRIASETRELRSFLSEAGFEVRQTLAADGILLGQPGAGSSVGRAAWVLYESTSTVLRRSLNLVDTFEAVAYHLTTLDAAAAARHRLPLLARPIITPRGSALLVDPYADSELAGLDRRLARAGFTVLPTTVASVDVERLEVVLPEHRLGGAVPSGPVAIEQVLYRSLPGENSAAARALRLARSIVRSHGENLDTVLAQIGGLVDVAGEQLQLMDSAAISHRLQHLHAP